MYFHIQKQGGARLYALPRGPQAPKSGPGPDIAIADSNSICTLELTVCYETNVVSSRDYKRDKYKNIADFRTTLAGNRKVYSHTNEISTLSLTLMILPS